MNNLNKTFLAVIAGIFVVGGISAFTGSSPYRMSFSSNYGYSNTVANDSDEIQIIIPEEEYVAPVDTGDYLPGEIRDTAAFMRAQVKDRDYQSRIHLLSRTYGDSIVLRWAPEDYVSWQYLNAVGIDVLRMTLPDGKAKNPVLPKFDTLVHRFKPATLEQWRAIYSENDSVAGVAIGALYGEGGFTQEQSRHGVGEMGALLDTYYDQQFRFGMAVLASEWRKDVAERLAMRFVDKNVKKGLKYRYIVRPSELDSTNHLTFRVGYINELENKPFVPETYNVVMGDSVVGINQIRIWWENTDRMSSFDIHRRPMGESKWTKLNHNPYVMMRDMNDKEVDNFINDNVGPGTYEYRISGYDAFGDYVSATNFHVATMPDLEAPRSPKLKQIIIDRRNDEDLTKDIFAEFHFSKDTMESDFIGYKILYYQRANNDDKAHWVELTPNLIPVTDTLCTVDVSGLSTSQVAVAAYDSNKNVSYSMAHTIRITDLTPPEAPKNFRYEIVDNAKGLVKLAWDAPAQDVDYYEIAFANDTTHQYMLRKTADTSLLRDTVFVDTLAVDVNQKYIYYKVRAVDYATNEGEYTAPLQVLRPSLTIPAAPHIDSLWVDQTKGVFMRWACSNEQQVSHHVLMRRLAGGTGKWTTVGVYNGDSLTAAGNILQVCDMPTPMRRSRYEYAMETFTYSGMTSGLSLVYSARYEGPKMFEWPIKLMGMYDKKAKQTKIVWETNDKLPYNGDWYFCIYRKGQNDKRHKFVTSVKKEDRMFQDYLLPAGESAEYYVRIRYSDGRYTTNSNTVTVTAPKEEKK